MKKTLLVVVLACTSPVFAGDFIAAALAPKVVTTAVTCVAGVVKGPGCAANSMAAVGLCFTGLTKSCYNMAITPPGSTPAMTRAEQQNEN